MIIQLVWIAGATAAGVLGLAILLMALGALGRLGRAVLDVLCRAPLLDVIVAGFTIAPWAPGAYFGGWLGLLAALVGQLAALSVWVIMHEWLYREAAAGPRIVKVINRAVGRWRNHAALWVTVAVLPVFWLIRLAQFVLYPMLVVLLGFPRYRQGDWVNVSRHKFEGLVGHDLIWCLYCDWMTGVYAFGAEMLRNVESFWCPIRFYDGKKCENCRVDFPDVDGGWVREGGTMAEVEKKMTEMYGSGRREWFGHPARGGAGGAGGASGPATPLTVEGADPKHAARP